MSEDKIVESFRSSIAESAVDLGAELAEVGLDSILDEGVLKDIPFISTAIGVYKIGATIKERHYIKKLARFIDAFNKGIDDADMRERIKSRFLDEKASKKELEYILLLIDRILDSLYNKLGLTTQIPKTIHVMSSAIDEKTKTMHVIFHIRRLKSCIIFVLIGIFMELHKNFLIVSRPA